MRAQAAPLRSGRRRVMLCDLASQCVKWTGALCAFLALGACGSATPDVAPEELADHAQAFVNGGDDRLEYFQLDATQREALEAFTVVLMSESAAGVVVSGQTDLLRTWGELNGLCDGEPFFEQPSASFCSGVLVDWDLVLTSGHCIDAVPLEELRIVFRYYYKADGQLGTREQDVYPVRRVIASRRDPEPAGDDAERLDFAWLELERPARLPHRPAPVFTRAGGVAESDPVISIGAGGGVPLKWDAGGHVQNTRPSFDDYFIADTDTSQGSSGGGVFDDGLAVVGSLARGAIDFTRTPADCYVTATESDPALAREQFTYAHRAVEGLCATGSSSLLCDAACEEPCDAGQLGPPIPDVEPESEAAAAAATSEDTGCALGAHRRSGPAAAWAALLAAAWLRRRLWARARASA